MDACGNAKDDGFFTIEAPQILDIKAFGAREGADSTAALQQAIDSARAGFVVTGETITGADPDVIVGGHPLWSVLDDLSGGGDTVVYGSDTWQRDGNVWQRA